MLSRPVSAPVKHTVSPAFAAGTLAPLALTVHFDVTGRLPSTPESLAGAAAAAGGPAVVGPAGAGAAVAPPFGLSITNEVVADWVPAFTVAVAGPVQVGVIANWASRASAVASIELRPVHPPIVTVKSTLDCRAKPVASSETEEALRSETTTAGAAGTAGATGAGGTAAGAGPAAGAGAAGMPGMAGVAAAGAAARPSSARTLAAVVRSCAVRRTLRCLTFAMTLLGCCSRLTVARALCASSPNARDSP